MGKCTYGRATNQCNKFKLRKFWECLLYEISGVASQIWNRDPRTPIPPHVMGSSAMELQSRYSCFCQPHTQKQTQTKCVHNLCTPYSVSCVFIFTLRVQHILTYRITVIVIARKTRILSIGAPCWDKWCRFWVSGLYLWCAFKLLNCKQCVFLETNNQIR